MSDYDVEGALAEVSQVTSEPAPEVTNEQPSEPILNLKWNGETKEFPQSKVIDLAQQGFDYNKKMADYNSQRKVWEAEQGQQQKQFDELKSRYEYLDQVDQYARANPTWLQQIQNGYAQATGTQPPVDQQAIDPTNPLAGTVNNLQSELSSIKQMLSAQQEAQQAQDRAKQDAEFDNVVNDYKQQNKQFDWNGFDPITGMNLEQKILDHAIKDGIKSFKAAANDYLFDEFIKQAQGQAKEHVAKDLQKKSILGFGPVTNQPTTGLQKAQNVADKSWDQLIKEGLDELGG